MTPTAAPYEDHVRAYGTVLDLADADDAQHQLRGRRLAAHTAQAQARRVAAGLRSARRRSTPRTSAALRRCRRRRRRCSPTRPPSPRPNRRCARWRRPRCRNGGRSSAARWWPARGLVTRLIERQEFLLQITLPPERIDRSAADGFRRGRRQLAPRRGALHLAGDPHRSEDPRLELLLRGRRQQRACCPA